MCVCGIIALNFEHAFQQHHGCALYCACIDVCSYSWSAKQALRARSDLQSCQQFAAVQAPSSVCVHQVKPRTNDSSYVVVHPEAREGGVNNGVGDAACECVCVCVCMSACICYYVRWRYFLMAV